MIKLNYWHFKVSKSIWILFFSLACSSFTKANPCIDTSKKQLIAAVSKKDMAGSVTLEANVVFPGILTGNEEQALLYIEKFAVNRRAYIIRTYNRSKKYFPQVSTILNKYDLPHELKVLLALESAFNANAVSKAGAVGYWQIMDDVAKEYGLKYVAQQKASQSNLPTGPRGRADKNKVFIKKVSKKSVPKPALVKDDRKNFNKSTYAAARYLKDRSKNLNDDILLMVASYNCGVGNVWEAMKKTGKINPGFWDIKKYLPAETQSYVMNFITLNVIFHNYDKFVNNKLLFTPAHIKIDNTEGSMTDEINSPSSINN